MKSWKPFLRQIILELGNRHSDLWTALGGSHEIEDRYHNYSPEWVTRRCLGRNAAPDKAPFKHRKGPHVGLYIEPSSTKVVDGEAHRIGSTSHVEYCVRLDLSRFPAEYLSRDLAREAAAAVADRFPAAGNQLSVVAHDYPYPQRPPHAQVQVLRLSGESCEDRDGLWLCIRSSIDFDFNKELDQRPQPEAIARELLEAWDRFFEVALFLSGVFAPLPFNGSKNEALIGFLGEFSVWRRLDGEVKWMGWQSSHDFVATDGSVYYEVKACADKLPPAPIFGAPEIRLALSCGLTGYELYLVNLRSSTERFIDALKKLPEDGKQTPTSTASAWTWLTRLLACLPENLHSKACSNTSRVEGLLTAISAGAEVKRMNNPFAVAPLSAFGTLVDRIVPSRFGVLIPQEGIVASQT